jgi:hypothetical protein
MTISKAYHPPLQVLGLLKKLKSINRKGRKVPIAIGMRKDRKELIHKILTLRSLLLLCVLCG